MQTHFAESIRELASSLDVPDTDYWYDAGSCYAQQILATGGEALLEVLADQIQGWNAVQQEHLAYILEGTSSATEIRLLKLLAESKNQDVAFRAREALHHVKD